MDCLRLRFVDKVLVDESGCWLWTGSVDGPGYGKISADGVLIGAHRVAYQLFVGPIPAGLHLDHLCRVRACVNPAHLEPVTHRENTRRGGPYNARAQQTHCKRGHPFDEDNTYLWRRSRHCRACVAYRRQARSGAKGTA